MLKKHSAHSSTPAWIHVTWSIDEHQWEYMNQLSHSIGGAIVRGIPSFAASSHID
jgi:hypothetical protein